METTGRIACSLIPERSLNELLVRAFAISFSSPTTSVTPLVQFGESFRSRLSYVIWYPLRWHAIELIDWIRILYTDSKDRVRL
uniref:Uncharacterized protein n=1 Tax=Loa loa TaxID=7209 RepID=A0A1I7VL67_LOALO